MARALKAVYFNSESEATLLDYANRLPNFSTFVKNCIKKELQPEQTLSPELEKVIKELLQAEIQKAGLSTLGKPDLDDQKIINDLEQYF